MHINMGLWIDHKQAVIVSLTDNGSSVEKIESQIESQPRREGDSPLKGSFEAQKVPSDNSHQREVTNNLNHYYDTVIEQIKNAGSVLIFGPGEAKVELNKRFESHHQTNQIVGVETVDKMTENQIVAKVRDHFSKD